MTPVSTSSTRFAVPGAMRNACRPAGVALHRPEPPYPEIDPDPQPDDGDPGPTDPPAPRRAPEGDPPSQEPPERVSGRQGR